MRDILFRAKRIDNGEWVEGYLLHANKNFFICCNPYTVMKSYSNKADSYGFASFLEVLPKTICQYIGSTDKKGKRIWKNDIVKRTDLHRVGEPSIGIIEYDIENTAFVIHWIDNPKYSPTYPWKDRIAVVGNIFDTPELLKED